MEDIFFHMLFVVPLTRWITSVGATIALVALFAIGVLQSSRQPNHFETIGVPPNSPPRVVSSAYRKLSLMYHPDKNPSMEAKEMFAKIREPPHVISEP
ncbi:DnaJ domain-containing protein, related [Eimeria acervulina]|uniref:DnaJ domain-containing protein, related n=1 Tax=Eimeria acervulina TaxID=5801 RepID=U6GD25_EIMAC|nr:DnaJ domain-containing protein, related [Eimeria acervulina]CDI76489.1 DnaJ domain-containing protein, related [Eimeria acervulina]